MALVQRYPDGLLQLLALQTSGLPPQDLIEQVAGNIDMLPFYLSPLQRAVNGGNVTLGGSGAFGVSLQVPADEFWIPLIMTLRVVCTSSPFSGLFGWRLKRNGLDAYLPGIPPTLGGGVPLNGVGASFEQAWQPPRLLLLRPGDQFEVEASLVSAGSAAGSVSGLVAVLR